MSLLGLILLILLIVLLMGSWPYRDAWGYGGPPGLLGLVLVVILVLVLLRYI